MKKMILKCPFSSREFVVGFLGLGGSLDSEYAVVMFDPEDENASQTFGTSEKNPYCRVPLRDLRPTPEDFNKIFRS